MNKQVQKLLKQFLIGAVVGATGAFIFDLFVDEGDLPVAAFHEGAALTALFLFVVAATVFVLSFSNRQIAEAYGGELEEGEDYGEDKSSFRAQALVTLLAAVEMAVLAIAPETLRTAAIPVLVGLAVLLVVQTAINWRIWKSGGEFLERLMVQVGALSFVLFQFGLFAWTAGNRLGYLPDASALDLYVALMVVYMLASGYIGIRLQVGSGRAVV